MEAMRQSRVKIVCTVGPASSSPDVLGAMVGAGMDIARVNYSYGTAAEKSALISAVRKAAEKAGTRIPVLQDLAGPKLRIGSFASGSAELKPGAPFILTSREVPGDAGAVTINCPEIIPSVEKGARILLGDGEFELKVAGVSSTDLKCEVVAGGTLKSNKGLHVPGARLAGLEAPTEKDLEDASAGAEAGVEMVAMSFVRSAKDIRALRAALRQRGSGAGIVAKIERKEAVEGLDAILAETDAVMVARGDLGLEIPLPQVPLAQKEIIRKANSAGIPVITATQILESMIANPRPTRAEVSDIVNAVLDGTDAVMLSGETAVGAWPVESVRTMDLAVASAEESLDYTEIYRRKPLLSNAGAREAMAHAACQVALETGASAIICCTSTGATARLVAGYRPKAKVLVASPNETVLSRSVLLWGAVPVRTRLAMDANRLADAARDAAVADGMVRKGDRVVVVVSAPGGAAGSRHEVRVETV
jgi:pyruvate kinase